MRFMPVAGPEPNHYPFTIDPVQFAVYTDETGRTAESPALVTDESTGVVLVIADSMLSNRSETAYTPTSTRVHQIDIRTGSCWRAKDPLLGVGGTLGGTLPKLGDALITEEVWERVIFLPVCVPATLQSHFAARSGPAAPVLPVAPDAGCLNHLIGTAIKRGRVIGKPIDAVLLGLGTNDAWYEQVQAQYETDFGLIRQTIRGFGCDAPIWVPKMTTNADTANSAIRAAQAAVVNDVDVFAGPDTDPPNYPDTHRRDGTHFGDDGTDAFAADVATLWAAHFA